MLCIIPVAESDEGHLQHFLSAMENFGPYPEDSCLIVVTPDVSEARPDLMAIVHRIRGLFGNAGQDCVKVAPNTPSGGWPLAPNTHFTYCIDEFSRLPRKEAFFYLETDSTPLRRGWLAQAKRDYLAGEKPYWGATAQTWLEEERMDKKNEPTGEFRARQDGHHMVGCGIYPADYLTRSATPGISAEGVRHTATAVVVNEAPRYNPNTLWKAPDSKLPFDVAMQSYHRPVQASRLFVHRWNTCNYRVVDGKVRCDDAHAPRKLKVENGAARGAERTFTQAGIVDLSEAVILHGCKDGSLAELAINGDLPDYEGTASREPDGDTSTELNDELEAARLENEALKRQLEAFQSQKEAQQQAAATSGLLGPRKAGRPPGRKLVIAD